MFNLKCLTITFTLFLIYGCDYLKTVILLFVVILSNKLNFKAIIINTNFSSLINLSSDASFITFQSKRFFKKINFFAVSNVEVNLNLWCLFLENDSNHPHASLYHQLSTGRAVKSNLRERPA